MFYLNLKFPKIKKRPFFYTNFVQTVDGKVQVLKKTKDYWPIGSRIDHDILVELRSYADCLIHGKNLAREFGVVTLKSLNNLSFRRMRHRMGKDPVLPYIVLSRNRKLSGADSNHLKGGLGRHLSFDGLKSLVKELNKKGYKHVLVEGGPTLLGSFLKENLIDEIFLTIAPKIFGNKNSSTLTLVEGILFPKEDVKKLSLISIKKVGDEIFLRYKVER